MTEREILIQELKQAPDDLVIEILQFLRERTCVTERSQPFDSQTQPSQNANSPIWELFEAAADEIPAEVLSQLPIDGAAQHDHYLYA
jgi:hypothetical protein